MIQFLGLDLSPESADAVALARDGQLTAERSTRVLNAKRDGEVVSVPPAEWVRAATYLLQELYLDLPVPLRKIWGLGLSGASGWVPLDLEYRPFGELRLLPPAKIAADIRRWLAAEPRNAKRLAAILSPKDLVRFELSGALASDVTLASRQGLLSGVTTFWDERRLAEEEIDPRWLPPVFECEGRTGQLTPEGVQRSGLPGGLYLVAGGLSETCARIAAGDIRRRVLWAPPGTSAAAYVTDERPPKVPPGFTLAREGWTGVWSLEREVQVAAEGEVDSAPIEEASIEACRRELEEAGCGVAAVSREPGRAAVGAAALAAIGSRLVKSWEDFYRGR